MATFSSALMRESRLKPWKTKPILSRRRAARPSLSSRETSTPSHRYVPDEGVSRQPIRFIKVDLPEPDGPMIATNSPRAMYRLTPFNATTSASLPGE